MPNRAIPKFIIDKKEQADAIASGSHVVAIIRAQGEYSEQTRHVLCIAPNLSIARSFIRAERRYWKNEIHAGRIHRFDAPWFYWEAIPLL